MATDAESCLAGTALYGDDFAQSQIDAWFEAEREGYAGLGAGEDETGGGRYPYHPLNERHGFRHLPAGALGRALGLGAAYGVEFEPIANRLESITILEPSQALRASDVLGVPLTYVDPMPNGEMPFEDANFDLVTCFGVLHHIPNVTTVVDEVARVLRPGGYFLVREPIHSMGDWRQSRAGLTKHERGIPRKIFEDLVAARFEVVSASLCDFPLMSRMGGPTPRNVRVDRALSRAFAWNYRYHANTRWQKIRPRSLAFVLRKP